MLIFVKKQTNEEDVANCGVAVGMLLGGTGAGGGYRRECFFRTVEHTECRGAGLAHPGAHPLCFRVCDSPAGYHHHQLHPHRCGRKSQTGRGPVRELHLLCGNAGLQDGPEGAEYSRMAGGHGENPPSGRPPVHRGRHRQRCGESHHGQKRHHRVQCGLLPRRVQRGAQGPGETHAGHRNHQ